MFCTPSVAIFRTLYNQLDSNLVNLDATVEGGINCRVPFSNNAMRDEYLKLLKFHKVV